MKKALIIVGIFVLLLCVIAYFWHTTKSFSPEASVDFNDGSLRIHVTYNRPYKKGRDIFGKLVPYGKTWRTGCK